MTTGPRPTYEELARRLEEAEHALQVLRDGQEEREATERKRAEESLRHSHELLKYIIEHDDTAVAVHDRDLRYIYVSQRYLDTYNLPAGNIIGKHHYEVFPDLPQKWRDVHQRALAGEVSSADRDTYPRSDGTVDWTRWECRPWHDVDGSIGGIILYTEIITDRVRAEEALRRSEQTFRSYIESSPIGIYVSDAQGNLVEANQAACAATGYTRDELLGFNVLGFYTSEQRPVAQAQFASIDRNGTLSAELPFVRKDGAERYWRIDATQLPDGRILGFAVDTTEQKQADQALRNAMAALQQSETLLAQSQEIAHVGSWMRDAAARLTWSDETYRIFGFSPQAFAVTYDGFLEAVHPDDRMGVDKAFSDSLRNGDPAFQIEHRIVRKHTGEIRDVWEQCVFERDASGAMVRAVGMVQDLTERKRAEGALRQFKTMFDTANFGAALATLDGRLFYVNACFAADHGYVPEELVGRTLSCLHSEAQIPDLQRLLDGLETAGSFGPVEVWHCHKDGTAFPMLMTGFAIRDAHGTPECLATTAIDLRERKALEVRLAQAQKMESVGRLAGGVAHDFNNMLGVILGYTEMARDQVSPDDPVSDYLREIHVAAQRSADITQQLLAFARKQTIAPRLLDLDDTVGGMLKMLRRLIGEDVDLAWLPDAPWPVLMDPSQVHQILANLCVNARDAIAGVGTITIETNTVAVDDDYCDTHAGFAPGDFVVLAVSDNGCGMDRAILDNLFEPFFTTKDISKGTGLGLATVYGIVKQNHGFINVYSEVGRGTTFRIYLPAHRLADALASPGAPETAPEARAGETILLVEDEPAILKLTTRMLERLGYRVLTTHTPGRALDIARQYAGEIHLVMTDVVMPGMNGRDLAQHLSAFRPRVKRLFMSGYTANVIAHHGVLDEGVQFIQKPFGTKDLATRVRQALDA